MRKIQKQEILEMIETLHEAHDEVKNYINKKNNSVAQDILGQCQECAITIGTSIENFEGEGFVTISYIEAYCETLFTIHEELNSIYTDANKAHKKLKKQLIDIENSVKNDIPLHKEVVFFPYKASMWDSLESVYLAVKEDPNCTVYCVPIPYYDKNPDRSLGQMHYEGREYPKNIEVIDWQTYNFEERKPDVIYIHNPYDDWNLVTSVHPRYYSENLKKNTEKLVYIPYFVLDEIEPNDQTSIDGMKHFCFLPGIINADNVIVQSEKMKQIYVNEYMKAAKSYGFQGEHIDRKKLEEKFLGLGSPKFDKVKKTKKEDLEIPEEWLKIIKKPDGSWKKIIFYNTSIAALLENNEKMLEKMKYVFKVFKENQDEIALLWRPHPLIKTTVAAMRPKLWEEYEKIVNQYRQEGWGIYDDSSDMDRAVMLSDAYYGDGSSVVQVCQQVEKPIMIQSEMIYSKKDEFKIYKAVEENNRLWFVAGFGFLECLYQLDLSKNEITCLGEMPSDYTREISHCAIGKINEKVIIAPYWSEEDFVEYDLIEQKYRRKTLEHNVDAKHGTFVDALIYGESVFFVGNVNGVIVEYRVNESKCIYHTEWAKEVKTIYEGELFFANGKCVDDILYLPVFNSNIVLEISIPTCKLKRVVVMPFEFYIKAMIYTENEFWFAPLKTNKIVKWNICNDKFQIIEIPINICMDRLFSTLIEYNKNIILLPEKCSVFYEVNTKEDVIEEREGYKDTFDKDVPIFTCKHSISMNDRSDSYYFLYNCNKKVIKKIYAQNGECEEYDIGNALLGMKKEIGTISSNWKKKIKYESMEHNLHDLISMMNILTKNNF